MSQETGGKPLLFFKQITWDQDLALISNQKDNS